MWRYVASPQLGHWLAAGGRSRSRNEPPGQLGRSRVSKITKDSAKVVCDSTALPEDSAVVYKGLDE